MTDSLAVPIAAPPGAASARRCLTLAVVLAPAGFAAVVASLALARAVVAFDTASGGDGVWLVLDMAASWAVAGWGALRVLQDRRDGAAYLLQWSGLAWAVAALCETGGLSESAWLPLGGVTPEVQVAAHLMARALLVAAIIIVLPDREADGFLRRGPAVAALAGLTVVLIVALTAQPVGAVLRDTPFGFGNRTWIEAGRHLPRLAVGAMVGVEAAALVALHRTRRGLPPTSFQVIGWALVAAAAPLAVPMIEERLPAVGVDVLAVVVFPALPVVSVVALLRTASTVARTLTRLRLAQQRMVEAVENERRRLRHDLHDGLGPALAGIALGMRAAASTVSTNEPATATLLGRLAEEAEACLEEVRRLVYDLRPPALDQLGLQAAVASYAERCCSAPEAPALQLFVEELPPLPAAVELAAYRIAVEAVTNAARHAQASTLLLGITTDGAVVAIEVTDDGRGLPVDLVAGVGLVSMRQRAESIGGQLKVCTGVRGGTSVQARLPLWPA